MKIRVLVGVLLTCGSVLASAGNMWSICSGSTEPVEGSIYDGRCRLEILQVLPDAGGVLVQLPAILQRGCGERCKTVFVKVETAGLTDGMDFSGNMFLCIGTYQYVTTSGAPHTIAAFRTLSKQEVQDIRTAEVAEEEKRCKLREEFDKQQQPERLDWAGRNLGALDFDVEKRFRVSRELSSRVNVKVGHFAWVEMKKRKAENNWLGLLNVICDVIEGRGDLTEQYKMYPDTNEMQRIVASFTNECPLEVKVLIDTDKKHSIFVKNENWLQRGSYPFVEFESRHTRQGYTRAPSPFGTIYYIGTSDQVGMFTGKYWNEPGKINELYAEYRRLGNKLEEKEISTSEYRSLAENIFGDKTLDPILNEMFVPLGTSEEVSKLRNQEKQKFAEEMAQKFLTVQLRLGDRLIVQKDLRQYIHRIEVPDLLWHELRKLQQQKDWQGMCRAIAKTKPDYRTQRKLEAKYKTRRGLDLDDFNPSNEKQLEMIWDMLSSLEFDLKVEFTYSAGFASMLIKQADDKNGQHKICKWHLGSDSSGGVLHQKFTCGDDPILIYSRWNDGDEPWARPDDEVKKMLDSCEYGCDEVDRQVKSRIIDAASAEEKKAELVRECRTAIRRWLDTKKVRVSDPQINVIRPTKCVGSRNISLLSDRVATLSDAEAATLDRDIKSFRKCYEGICPSKKMKSKRQKCISVLAQALKNETMSAIYKKYCKGEAKMLYATCANELKACGDDEKWAVYGKYFDLYVGALNEVALNGGCNELESIVNIAHKVMGESRIVTVKCPTCKGLKYVKVDSECSACSGTGKIVHPAKKMVSGWSAERMGTCQKCNGKGKIKKKIPCPKCQNESDEAADAQKSYSDFGPAGRNNR